MTVATVPGRVSPEHGGRHSRLARWAVGLMVVFGAALATSLATLAIGSAVLGWSGLEDTWVALLAAEAAIVGLLTALAAFVLALAARIRRERWALLWLPLGVFPACVLLLVLGETLWWE